jgi:hypothetical protein
VKQHLPLVVAILYLVGAALFFGGFYVTRHAPDCPPCSPEPCAQHEVGDDAFPPVDTGWTHEVPDAR